MNTKTKTADTETADALREQFNEEEVRTIRASARQMVRYENWTDAVATASRVSLKTHGHRRAVDIYRRENPPIPRPKRPVGMTEREWKKGPELLNFFDAATAREEELREAARDKRERGSTQRRGNGFSEKTGSDVIDELTGDDVKRWAHLASQAIQESRTDAFREKCGRPKTPSEIYLKLEAQK